VVLDIPAVGVWIRMYGFPVRLLLFFAAVLTIGPQRNRAYVENSFYYRYGLLFYKKTVEIARKKSKRGVITGGKVKRDAALSDLVYCMEVDSHGTVEHIDIGNFEAEVFVFFHE
jgi:hypothetical protein